MIHVGFFFRGPDSIIYGFREEEMQHCQRYLENRQNKLNVLITLHYPIYLHTMFKRCAHTNVRFCLRFKIESNVVIENKTEEEKKIHKRQV